MTITILSPQSKWIQAYVQESMKQEAEKLGFDPWGDIFQDEYERKCLECEQKSLENPNIDWEYEYINLHGSGAYLPDDYKFLPLPELTD